MFSIGQTAIISMISHLIFIFLTWKAMQSVKFDPLIRKGKALEARIFLLFIAIAIGAGVSRFFLEFLQWSSDLTFLFN
ncbi:DUF1146 domain-containing protein [Cerasibacillus terrae]|uniref:DUF1146 domain-containing protein n=1 Tax=Cerasibacillus terrae TaxID=2498845 RepID=A0A5C8NZB7_9BACI|nr:DUF1146 family protein [Cerasibacillus terrae]TXL66639.1 DUF1146 domain-containing protein [Cerasibacillus terrae]